MYGRRASQLLKEIDSSEAGQLAPFNVIPASLNSPADCSYCFGIRAIDASVFCLVCVCDRLKFRLI